MSYITGKAKSLEDITLEDALKHPIWEWALDGEKEPDQDETWQRPIINTTDVTKEMVQPTITLRLKGLNLYGSAEYNLDEDVLESIAVWYNDEWVSIYDMDTLTFPVVFVAIPTIQGVPNIEFEYSDWEMETAIRVK